MSGNNIFSLSSFSQWNVMLQLPMYHMQYKANRYNACTELDTNWLHCNLYIYTQNRVAKNTQTDDKLSTIKQDKKTNQKNTWQSINSKLTSIAKWNDMKRAKQTCLQNIISDEYVTSSPIWTMAITALYLHHTGIPPGLTTGLKGAKGPRRYVQVNCMFCSDWLSLFSVVM